MKKEQTFLAHANNCWAIWILSQSNIYVHWYASWKCKKHAEFFLEFSLFFDMKKIWNNRISSCICDTSDLHHGWNGHCNLIGWNLSFQRLSSFWIVSDSQLVIIAANNGYYEINCVACNGFQNVQNTAYTRKIPTGNQNRQFLGNIRYHLYSHE